MSPIPDEQLIEKLCSMGVPIENFFVVTNDPQVRGLIAFWHPEVGARFLILEKEVLATACYEYLLKRGARRFNSGDEIFQTADAEKWPGWNTNDTYLRD